MWTGLRVYDITQYQGEALGGGSPSLDCCQWPLLHHILRLLIHSHHWLFGYPQQPRDQFIFTLHLFLPDRETSDSIYAVAKHLHRWFIQGADAKLLCLSASAVVMHTLCPCLEALTGGGGGAGAAVKWPRKVQACLTAALLNGVSVGFSHCQETSMVLPPALSAWSAPVLSLSLPTGNLLQLTSETEPTLGSPPEAFRMTQILTVCRGGRVRNMHILRPRAIVFFFKHRVTTEDCEKASKEHGSLKHKGR